MVRKTKADAEHERWWARELVELGGGAPDDPADSVYASISPEMQAYREKMETRQVALPDESVLTREEYLAMQRAIENPTRHHMLQALVTDGDLHAGDLAAALDLGADDVHDHLDELINVGLVQPRQRNDPDQPGIDSYYRATTLAEGLLKHGVVELVRREREFLEAYG